MKKSGSSFNAAPPRKMPGTGSEDTSCVHFVHVAVRSFSGNFGVPATIFRVNAQHTHGSQFSSAISTTFHLRTPESTHGGVLGELRSFLDPVFGADPS